jgi:small subunit ribosomal protein S8
MTMTINDPIADLLTRVRNALMAGHGEVSIPRSAMKVAIAQILKDEGYIKDFKVIDDKPVALIHIIEVLGWAARQASGDHRPEAC